MNLFNGANGFCHESKDHLLLRSKKIKSPIKLKYKLENNRYIPEGPYPRRMIKKADNSLEKLLFQDPLCCSRLFYWAQKTLKPNHPFRTHLEWMDKAMSLLPRPTCFALECKEQARYLTVRTSRDNQKTFGFPFVFCEKHALEEKQGDPLNIDVLSLKPSSISYFSKIPNKYRQEFWLFLGQCLEIIDVKCKCRTKRQITGERIFKAMKKCLPSIEISAQIQTPKTPKKLEIQYPLDFKT